MNFMGLNFSNPFKHGMGEVPNMMAQEHAQEAAADDEQERMKKRFETLQKKQSKKEASLISRLMGDQAKGAKQEMMEAVLKSGKFQQTQSKTQQLQEKMEKDLAALFKDDTSYEDQIDVSPHIAKETAKMKQRKFVKERESQYSNLIEPEVEEDAIDLSKGILRKSVKEAKEKPQRMMMTEQQQKSQMVQVKQFSQLLAQYAGTQSPVQKQQMEKVKREMKQNGVTERQIQTMENRVGKTVYQHFMYDLKRDLLKFYFSADESKQTRLKAELDFNAKSEHIQNLKEQGVIKQSLHGVMESMGAELRKDIEHFLYEEASTRFQKVSMGEADIDTYTQELLKLQKIASAAGVVINEEHLNMKIEKTIEDLGLQEFIPPVGQGSVNYQDGSQQQKEKEPEKLYVNQAEQLEDQLRNLYMIRALHPELSQSVKLAFKMKKLRNGLIKLGINVEGDDVVSLQKQGEFLAQMKLMDELRQGFREQATLQNLSGTAYNLIKKKRAFVVKRLKKIGVRARNEMLDRVRDEMNREMATLVREELHQVEVMLETRPMAALSAKRKHLKGILDRISDETDLRDILGLDGTDNDYNERTIVEAA